MAGSHFYSSDAIFIQRLLSLHTTAGIKVDMIEHVGHASSRGGGH